MHQLFQLAGMGALGGVGVRSLMGLRDMMQNDQIPVSPSASLPHTISIYGQPKHPGVPEEEEKMAGWAGAGAGALGALLRKPLQAAGGAIQSGMEGVGDMISHIPEHMAHAGLVPETHTTKPLANEWGIPAGMLALGAGGYGGYKAIDWMLNQERAGREEGDVADAEDDYNKALAEQYRAAMMAKQGTDDLGLGELSDTYAAVVEEHGHEKVANMSLLGWAYPPLDDFYSGVAGYDNWQALKGGANAATLATGLGAAKLTYDWAKGQNRQQLLQKALQRRQMQRQRMSPPPILALPKDTPAKDAA